MSPKSLFFVILLLGPALFGDTIEFTDGASWSGKVEYKCSDFTLNARFPGGTKRTLHWPREVIKEIEINDNDYNPGSPLPWLASDSIAGCLIGTSKSRFFLVPDHKPVA